MPLANYIRVFIELPIPTQIHAIKDGKYSWDQLETLKKHTDADPVLDAIDETINAMGNGNLTVVEGEIIKAGDQKATTVTISTDQVVQWHTAAQQHAQLAVLCAARAGAELNRIKAECSHGEWQHVLKTLPFGTTTSKKYRSLAEELQARLQQEGASLNLLELPEGADFSDPTFAETVSMVNAVTGESSLRQLYFDWGILKEPCKKGGDRGGGQARANMTVEEAEAKTLEEIRRNWKESAAWLASEGLDEMSWAELNRPELLSYQALFQKLADNILSHLNRK